MKSASDLLKELNSIDESTSIEAKTASEIGKSILETVCAFSNEPGLGGGYLLLGVQRVGTLFEPQYEPAGLDDPDKIQNDLISQCSSAFNRPIRPKVSVEKIGDQSVVVVFIPEAAATDKPIFLTRLNLPRGAYRRIGPTDHEGTEDDLIALYANHQADTFDTTVITDGTMDDIDPAAIAEYRSLRAKVNPDAEELGWSDADLLLAFGCTRNDGGQVKPTVAGIILFGTPMSLRRCFPMMRIDYIRVPGREWVQDPDHRFDTVEIRTPLIGAIRKATNAILDDLPKSFSLPSGEIQSKEQPLLPNRVIREAIVNAVMHRSYRIHGSVQIIRYANRIEIRNPGHSLKAEDRLGEPGSETRNPKIATVLHEVNIAETKGSGIRVMRELMQRSNLLPPTFESSHHGDTFVATFLFHHFLGPEDVAWLARLTTEKLSDEEARALVFVRELGAVGNAAYRDINQVATLDASTHLRRLRDLELLQKKGSGNKTYYLPGPLFFAAAEAATNGGQEPAQATSAPALADPESRKAEAQSRKLPEQLTTEHIPDDLARSVVGLSKRPNQADLRGLIGRICSWQPLTAIQLASVLSRQREPLVRDHLRPMIEAGDLAYTIPEMPNHPDQRYTAPAPADNGGQAP